jgi:uncharacterized membrane protein
MSWYEFLLFVHIAAAVIWIGAGFLLLVLGIRADRSNDEAGIKRLLDDEAWLATHLFIPASLTVFVAGVLLTIEGSFRLDQLWIVLGLIGYFATFVTGVAVLKPQGDRINAMMERDGGLTPESLTAAKRLLRHSRIDYVVLLLVIAVMVIKPTGDDVGVLIGMAAVLGLGIASALAGGRTEPLGATR